MHVVLRGLGVAACCAVAASCVTTGVGLGASPAVTKRYPLRFTASATGAGAPVQQLDALISQGLRFNGAFFKSCSVSQVQDAGAASCPSRSRIGSGSATVKLGKLAVTESIAYYNGPGGKSVTAVFSGTFSAVVKGTIGVAASPYSRRVRFQFPTSFQHPVTGVNAELTTFSMNLTGTVRAAGRRTYPIVGFRNCPASGHLTFGASFLFAAGGDTPTLTSSYAAPCPGTPAT